MAGRAGGRSAAGRVFPCRLHPTCADRRGAWSQRGTDRHRLAAAPQGGHQRHHRRETSRPVARQYRRDHHHALARGPDDAGRRQRPAAGISGLDDRTAEQLSRRRQGGGVAENIVVRAGADRRREAPIRPQPEGRPGSPAGRTAPG